MLIALLLVAAPDAGAYHHVPPARGPSAAPVTILEFIDLNGERAGQTLAVNDELMAEYPGLVRYEVRQFPSPSVHPHDPSWAGKDAKTVAIAAMAAHEEGKFWEYEMALLTHRKHDRQALKLYAKQVGIDVARFRSAVDSNRYEAALADDLNEAAHHHVVDQPTFIIGDLQMVGVPRADELKPVIEEKLIAAGRKSRPDCVGLYAAGAPVQPGPASATDYRFMGRTVNGGAVDEDDEGTHLSLSYERTPPGIVAAAEAALSWRDFNVARAALAPCTAPAHPEPSCLVLDIAALLMRGATDEVDAARVRLECLRRVAPHDDASEVLTLWLAAESRRVKAPAPPKRDLPNSGREVVVTHLDISKATLLAYEMIVPGVLTGGRAPTPCSVKPEHAALLIGRPFATSVQRGSLVLWSQFDWRREKGLGTAGSAQIKLAMDSAKCGTEVARP